MGEQGADQRRLADTGRSGDADDVCAAGLRIELADDLVGERIGVLDKRDRPRKSAPVALADGRRERLARPVPPPSHAETLRRRTLWYASVAGRRAWASWGVA